MVTQSTNHIATVGVWSNLLKNTWFPVLNYQMAGVLKNFDCFRNTFRITILLFDGLYPDRVMFSGNSLSAKKLYLIYGWESEHYNVITNLKGAMAKTYICNGCDTLHYTQEWVCSLCTATPPVIEISPSIVVHVIGIFSVRSDSRII